MKPLGAIRRAIAARIPGSVAGIAAQKREYERGLRKAGHSHTEAARLTWEYFNRGKAG